jgi:predicted amidohydrolase YtcJ/acetyl esterase/lipase
MKTKFAAVAFAAILTTACNNAPEEQVPTPDYADTVLINGKVLTVDNEFSVVSAIAIEGERIAAVGDNDAVSALIGDSTEVIDLQGKTVIPGLIDNHIHFIRMPQRWNLQARIDAVNSRVEALEIITAKAATMEPGEWIMVQGGWSESQFADEQGGFTLEELDAAAPNNPVFLQILYTHAYANTLAIEAVGADPANGSRLGNPYIVAEPPYGLLNEQMPPVSAEQLEQNVLDVIAALNKAGLTSVYDVGRPPEGDITLLDRMSENGPLNLRVWHTLKYQAYDPEGADAAIELINAATANSTDDYLGLLGVGEHVYLPMFDLPNVTEPYPDEVVADFGRVSRAAAEGGFRINEHSMMDVTIGSILDAWEEINEDIPLAPLRWSLEHVLTISDESIERAKNLGVTMAVHSVAANMPPFLQPPVAKFEESGVVWGLGTDASVVAAYQPFLTLGWVVSGKSLNGSTLIEDTLSREAALIAHTRSNAFLLHKDEDLGSLEVGKLADLVVLDRDYMTVPADEIVDIQPVMTMVGGRVVYQAEDQFAQAPPPPGGPGVPPPGGPGGPPPPPPVSNLTPDLVATYKSVDGTDLKAHIFNAQGSTAANGSAALVFMHGGGLRQGSPSQGYELAGRFTEDGITVVAVQYRLLGTNADSLDQIVADAKSSIRWLRENSEDLGIDPDRIVMAGHSAGAYLTLSTGVVPTFDEESESREVSSVPNALIPWSAIITRNDDPENSMVPPGMMMEDFSPASYVRGGLPPALFIHGDADPIASYEVAMNFEERYRAAGNDSSFHIIEGADHFFRPPEHREQVMTLIGDYLDQLGYANSY